MSLLITIPVVAMESENGIDVSVQADFAGLPEADEMGDAFRAFDDDLKSYEGVCDTIPVEENPRWKVWGARIASAIYGSTIATKKFILRCYYAWKTQLTRVMQVLARQAATPKNN